jgi:hypothetical protein
MIHLALYLTIQQGFELPTSANPKAERFDRRSQFRARTCFFGARY